MTENENSVKLIEELLNGVDSGEFSDAENAPSWFTYGHLDALLRYAGEISGGKDFYIKMYDMAIRYGINKIRKKVGENEKIKVAFLAISAAEWPADGLYRRMEQDERIENYIVACPLCDRDAEDALVTYRKTCSYFERNGYAVRKAYDEELSRIVPWEQIGGMPDIIVHLTSWHDALPAGYQIDSLPAACLNCYIPYGTYTANNGDGQYVIQCVYNKGFVNLLWRVYADSERNLLGYQTYGLLCGKNARYSGYCKMDYFFRQRSFSDGEVRQMWKIPEGVDVKSRKRIIIAPHHSVSDEEIVSYSTFHQNMFFWPYLAKKYENEISFILKPHPNLRFKSVRDGLFRNYGEYDAYMDKWDSLPNARLVDEDEYLSLFATSDGMIMDSASFLVEYMYVNKPLLFLRKHSQAFNALGEKMMEGYYKADGNDYDAIEQFVQKVILQENDTMERERASIMETELDYEKKNKCSASEFIYRDILDGLGI